MSESPSTKKDRTLVVTTSEFGGVINTIIVSTKGRYEARQDYIDQYGLAAWLEIIYTGDDGSQQLFFVTPDANAYEVAYALNSIYWNEGLKDQLREIVKITGSWPFFVAPEYPSQRETEHYYEVTELLKDKAEA